MKKQKQIRERPTQGRGATFIMTNDRFHTREGSSRDQKAIPLKKFKI